MKEEEVCAFCDKLAILICPVCNWEVCEDHSRKDGKCIYCTKIGVIINQDAVDHIIEMEKILEEKDDQIRREKMCECFKKYFKNKK